MTGGWSARQARILVAAALCLFLGGIAAAIVVGLGEDDSSGPVAAAAAPRRTTPKPAHAQKPRLAPLVKLKAVGAFDPEGDGHERDDEAPLAVDGRPDTAWETEHYSTFFKSGVGVVLDMGRRRRVRSVTVDSPSKGVTAEIRLGDSAGGPFTLVSPAKPLSESTRFAVAGRAGRYVVVWIVGMPADSSAKVAEVRVRAT